MPRLQGRDTVRKPGLVHGTSGDGTPVELDGMTVVFKNKYLLRFSLTTENGSLVPHNTPFAKPQDGDPFQSLFSNNLLLLLNSFDEALFLFSHEGFSYCVYTARFPCDACDMTAVLFTRRVEEVETSEDFRRFRLLFLLFIIGATFAFRTFNSTDLMTSKFDIKSVGFASMVWQFHKYSSCWRCVAGYTEHRNFSGSTWVYGMERILNCFSAFSVSNLTLFAVNGSSLYLRIIRLFTLRLRSMSRSISRAFSSRLRNSSEDRKLYFDRSTCIDLRSVIVFEHFNFSFSLHFFLVV